MPGYEIKRSRFSGTIGTDNTGHLALLDRQIEVANGHKALKRFGYTLNTKQH